MGGNIKIALKNALLFSIFELLMIYFFDIFSFINDIPFQLILFSIVFGLIFFVHFFSLLIINKMIVTENVKRNVTFFSYISTAFISAIIFWSSITSENNFLPLFLSAFVIPALLPSITFFLLYIFKENESKEPQPQIVYVEQTKEEIKEEQIIRFVLENESGKKLLDIAINRIICFEANDNYVVTYYLDKEDKVKKSMERISLKKIEEMLDGLGVKSFSRVHKSYLVHQLFIDEIKGKAQAQKIKLHHLEILVPVSRMFNLNTLDINR